MVSDGSTDKTVEIARGYDGIRLIAFERNRGYGAAIKRGFEEVESDLVGFLDADGTCDPRFFADLCTGLCASDASVALGSRMGPGSQMPNTRRLGNKIYACILSVLTNQVVHDTASGMRVIRRSALERLYPLPDGLNFTPAMSARAMLDDKLPVLELPMSYKERVGESKLNVLHDGWRFFETIMEMTLFWRPARVFLSGAILCALVTVILAAHPIEMWLKLGHLEESMIYRLLFLLLPRFAFCVVRLSADNLGVAPSLHTTTQVAKARLSIVLSRRFFTTSGIAYVTAALGTLAGIIVGPGVWSWVTEGQGLHSLVAGRILRLAGVHCVSITCHQDNSGDYRVARLA